MTQISASHVSSPFPPRFTRFQAFYPLLSGSQLCISAALILSLFAPWAISKGDFMFGSLSVNGLLYLFFVAIMSLDRRTLFLPLCLPLYFIVNLWFGRDSRPLVMCRLFFAVVSLAIQLYVWHSADYAALEWGYWLALLTMGIGMIKDLCILAMMIEPI